VLDSLDLAQRTGHLEVQVEEVLLRRGCVVCGRSLRESRLREKFGVLIVALRRANSEVVFNPPDDMAPAENDTLVVMGRRAELDRLERSIVVP
jgi:voltage-gated potassium channel